MQPRDPPPIPGNTCSRSSPRLPLTAPSREGCSSPCPSPHGRTDLPRRGRRPEGCRGPARNRVHRAVDPSADRPAHASGSDGTHIRAGRLSGGSLGGLGPGCRLGRAWRSSDRHRSLKRPSTVTVWVRSRAWHTVSGGNRLAPKTIGHREGGYRLASDRWTEAAVGASGSLCGGQPRAGVEALAQESEQRD